MASYVYKHSLPGLILAAAERVFAVSKTNNDRKLAVILVADVAGYSKAMEQDEDRTIANFKDCRAIFEALADEFNGRIFNTAGDSFLTEFQSAVAAVEFGVAFQMKMGKRNQAIDKVDQLRFRIGVNMGDVVIDGRNLYGDGVNVAARLESLAQPEGLCISKSVHDFAAEKTYHKFNKLGRQKVKQTEVDAFDVVFANLEKRNGVRLAAKNGAKASKSSRRYLTAAATILLAVCLASLGWIYTDRTKTTEQSALSTYDGETTLVILPFKNMSPSSEHAFLNSSMLDYLIPALTGFDNLNILSKETSRYIDDQLAINPNINEQFGVEFTLSGTMVFLGDQVRTTYELVDNKKQEVVWSQTDDRSINDFFGLQDQIGAEVLSVFDRQSKNLTFGGLSTPAEVKLRSQFQNLFRTFDPANWSELNRVSLKLYDSNPDGYIHNLVMAWNLIAKLRDGLSENLDEDRQRALTFTKRAMQIDENRGNAYLTDAFIRLDEGDYKNALINAKRGFSLSINDMEDLGIASIAFLRLAEYSLAVEAFERIYAVVPEPDPIWRHHAGVAYLLNGNLVKARPELEFSAAKRHLNPFWQQEAILLLAYISDLEGVTGEAEGWMAKFNELQLPDKPALQIVQNTDKKTFDAFQKSIQAMKNKYPAKG